MIRKTGKLIEKFRILERADVFNMLSASEKVELWTMRGKISGSLWREFGPDVREFPELEHFYNR